MYEIANCRFLLKFTYYCFMFSFPGKIINDVDIAKVMSVISNWCGPDLKLLYIPEWTVPIEWYFFGVMEFSVCGCKIDKYIKS